MKMPARKMFSRVLTLFTIGVFAMARALEAEGILFQSFVLENMLSVPAKDASVSTLVVLKITNAGKDDQIISKYETPKVVLHDKSGMELLRVSYRDSIIPPEITRDFVLLSPGGSTYLSVECKLQWQKNLLCLTGRSVNGEYWYVEVHPGVHEVSLRYTVKGPLPKNLPNENGTPFWTGSVTTTPVKLVIQERIL